MNIDKDESPELAPIREALDVFLASPDPGVLAIKGDWGAGKTYFVNDYLRVCSAPPDQPLSVVTLFGLSRTEDIRRQIIPNAISLQQFRNPKNMRLAQKLTGLARTLPKISDWETFIQHLENNAIRDLLLVFDDIERKSDSLPLKNVLGFVNYLSEHANCKVILILNEDELGNEDKPELGKFREKLIDRELLFAPTYETNARRFFHDPELFERALDVFKRCECRNLRVIKRCHSTVTEFRKRFKDLSASGSAKLLDQVLLLSCLFYRYGGEIEFDALTSERIITLFSPSASTKVAGVDILKKVGYRPTDADTLIIHYLKTGFFEPTLVDKLRETDSQMAAQQVTWDDIEQTFQIFNSNFGGTSEEFVSQLEGFFARNISLVGWGTFRQGLDALKLLGLNAEANKWTDEFILRRASSFSFSECEGFLKLGPGQKAQEAVLQRKSEILKARHPNAIMEKMMSDRGWSKEDTAALDQYDASVFEELFKADRDDDFLSLLREFVKFFNPNQPEPVSKSIGVKIFAALRNLAAGNKFILAKITQVIGISEEELFPSKASEETDAAA